MSKSQKVRAASVYPNGIFQFFCYFQRTYFHCRFLSKTNLSLEIYNIVLKGWVQGSFSTAEKIIRFGGWRLYPEAHVLESHNLGNIISFHLSPKQGCKIEVSSIISWTWSPFEPKTRLRNPGCFKQHSCPLQTARCSSGEQRSY